MALMLAIALPGAYAILFLLSLFVYYFTTGGALLVLFQRDGFGLTASVC